MKKKFLVLFAIISSLAFSDTRDLKMKMILNKENVNQIMIDIVPENWEENKIQEPTKKIIKEDLTKPKKVIKKKSTKKKPIEIIKEKKIEKEVILKPEIIKEEKNNSIQQEEKPIEIIKPVEKIELENKINKNYIILSLVGALIVIKKIIKKIKGGK